MKCSAPLHNFLQTSEQRRINESGEVEQWDMESEATGIAQLAEPLLVKETRERVQKSLNGLNVYLQTTQSASTRDAGLPISYKPGPRLMRP